MDSGLAERITLWNSALEIWKISPITGTGAGQFKAHYLSGQAKALEHTPESHGLGSTGSAHNILLHLLAEYGMAGLLLWLIISLLLITTIWTYRYKSEAIRWPVIASATALWIQGHINISLTEPFPLILLALFLGISCKPFLYKLPSISLHKAWVQITSATIIMLLLTGAMNATERWSAFGTWLQMDINNPEKGRLAAQLANHDEMLPYIVDFSIHEMVNLAEKQQMIGKMQPLILKAISFNQRPSLYKHLFFSQLINNELEQACETGQFIQAQRWTGEANAQAYSDACSGIRPDRYQY